MLSRRPGTPAPRAASTPHVNVGKASRSESSDRPTVEARALFTRCLFCQKPFTGTGSLGPFPHGRRVAYDPERGRLWAVCDRCHRWNLAPMEERAGVVHELERRARDRSRLVGRTENVSLLEAGELVLIRIGDAGLAEQSWWRYGRELRRRKLHFDSPVSRITAYTYGAVAYIGESVGLTDSGLEVAWDDSPLADILRWRRFGWAAWRGRTVCPFCQSTLRALLYSSSWWVYPRWDPDGRLALGVPCMRCDPWTPEKVYSLRGDEAENTLRRLLAYQHIRGAPEGTIIDAARAIEDAGSAGAFTRAVARGGSSLWRLRGTRSIALEIAVNEAAERRLLGLEARALEFVWRREEELAQIIDHELTPRRILERHVRRFPAASTAADGA